MSNGEGTRECAHMADAREPSATDKPDTGVLHAEPSPPVPGWLPPDPGTTKGNDLRRGLVIGCVLAFALFSAGPLIFLAIYNATGGSGPSVQSVAFGRAGSGCEVTRTDTSFPPGTLIRAVAMFSPSLQAGNNVTVTIYRDGAELLDYHQVVPVEEPSDCVFIGLAPLEPGRYRVEFALEESPMPPLSGEFDISAD